MSANQSATMYESIPVVSELNKVQGFDPLKFLRKNKDGSKGLDLKYKKLWFRLKYPNGRIKLSTVRITDQLAIIEARVYFDKNDTQPKASFIAQRDAKTTPGGLYIESAQHAAIDQALSDAGFGVQFTSVAENGSNASVVQTVKEQPVVTETIPVKETATVVEKTPVTETVAQQSVIAPRAEEPVVTPVTEEAPAVVEDVIAEQPAEVVEAVTEATAETVAEPVTEVIAEDEGEEVEDEVAESIGTGVAYTADMSVADICSMMTLEEAGNVIVPIGTCKDWTMAQVADRRPASLKWYINGYTGNDNILRAAATIMQETLELQKAS
ncbi:MAG: hypothetical protein GX628_07870 [Clostridiales bacterium]|nr:hypothetical protein [Clostridiales bacterium]